MCDILRLLSHESGSVKFNAVVSYRGLN